MPKLVAPVTPVIADVEAPSLRILPLASGVPAVGCTCIAVVCPIMMLSSPPSAVPSVVNVTVICDAVIPVSVRAVISPAAALMLGVCPLLYWICFLLQHGNAY